MSAGSWKERLGDAVPETLAQEIDVFEEQIARKKSGRMDEKLFAETRLRRGAYGQRYDNGLRNDGRGQRRLAFPSDATKGVDTVFDAPGMQRIKNPYGLVTADQMEVMAECAEEYADRILHVTTRQDIQLHFVHVEDTPDMHRRLASGGSTTREACGNSVRNITACVYAGVCSSQSFDVTPYAEAAKEFLLGHPDVQDFGRKFKIAFSGCHDEPCGLVTFHDLGAVAKVREVDGAWKRGFELVVGGGLGAVPVEAKVLTEFCPEEELLPLTQAVCRVFARLGEKQSRARARIKFLVQKTGIEEFRRLVAEERALLRPDPRWTAYLENLSGQDVAGVRPAGPLPEDVSPDFARWAATNLRPQAQEGYFAATVTCPLGDFTADQARGFAALMRRYTGDKSCRLAVDQNVVFRWLSGADAPAFYARLQELGVADHGAGTLLEPTSCPGTDTCKLGIASSRGLTGELRRRLRVLDDAIDPDVKKLRIKASGCFNSCSQHHVADLGFMGVARNVGGRKVPHFNVVLGGQWTQNAGSYGQVVGAVPSKNVPDAVKVITDAYLAEREDEESFQAFVRRVGKGHVKKLLRPLMKPPSYEESPDHYRDWRDPREFGIGDLGVGECAGEVVPWVEYGLQTAEQELDAAQAHDEAGRFADASRAAFGSMITAARALLEHLEVQVRKDPEDVVEKFRTHLHETKLFHDPFAKGKFATYLLAMRASGRFEADAAELAHRNLDEANLFLEAAHAAYARLTAAAIAAGKRPSEVAARDLGSPEAPAPSPAE